MFLKFILFKNKNCFGPEITVDSNKQYGSLNQTRSIESYDKKTDEYLFTGLIQASLHLSGRSFLLSLKKRYLACNALVKLLGRHCNSNGHFFSLPHASSTPTILSRHHVFFFAPFIVFAIFTLFLLASCFHFYFRGIAVHLQNRRQFASPSLLNALWFYLRDELLVINSNLVFYTKKCREYRLLVRFHEY